jgi:hypothetical protein
MSFALKMKDTWQAISRDPGIVSGVVQIIASLTNLLVSTLTRKRTPDPSVK